jgi:membrane protease YdiL (CAAX protease family)
MASGYTVDGSDAADYLRALSVAVGLAAAGFLVSNLLLLPVVLVFSALEIPLQSTIGYAISTIVQGIAFVGVVLAYMRYANRPTLLDIRWPSLENAGRTLRDVGWVIVGIVLLFVAARVVGLVLQQLGFAPGTNQVVRAVKQNPTLALYLVVLSFVAVGPGEETLFRGGVQGTLRDAFSPVPAVFLSSALFGLAHATAIVAASGLSGIVGYILSAFLLGLVLGGLYEYTENLLVPILVHGAYNAVLFAQLYLIQTGALGV